MKKQDEMRREYDFSRGVRGKFYGKVTGVKIIKGDESEGEEDDLVEINSLFRRLWNKAEGQEGYRKSEWLKLRKLLNKRNIPVSSNSR
jgi:hypothetical protein